MKVLQTCVYRRVVWYPYIKWPQMA